MNSINQLDPVVIYRKVLLTIAEGVFLSSIHRRFAYVYHIMGASLVAQLVKNPPALLETWVRFLGWKDPLKKDTATHSSIVAWRIPWTVLVHGFAKSQT